MPLSQVSLISYHYLTDDHRQLGNQRHFLPSFVDRVFRWVGNVGIELRIGDREH